VASVPSTPQLPAPVPVVNDDGTTLGFWIGAGIALAGWFLAQR
jgi:hypothetical protein